MPPRMTTGCRRARPACPASTPGSDGLQRQPARREDQGCASVGVDEIHGAAARLLGNEPNPFVESTTIRFDLPRSGEVNLRVFDAAGRTVRVLLNERVAAGPHQTVWDGRDASGRQMPSGVYFYALKLDGSAETRA